MADTLDILTLEEGYQAINDSRSADAVAAAGSGGHDDVLARWITGVSRRIDDLCGPVVQRTVTAELHDGGDGYIWPRKTPVASVTTLTEYDSTSSTTLTAETNASKPSDGYLLDERSNHYVLVRRRTSNADTTFASGRRNIELTYVAGRATATATVDPKFKMAAAAILRRIWSRDAGAWARGGDPFDATPGSIGFFRAVDPMVSEWLQDELVPPGVA